MNTIAPSAGAPPVVERAPSAPVAQAVATDLSPAKTVNAAETSQAAQNTRTPSPDYYQRTVLLDPATQDLIFRTIDIRSRQVVRQVPDEALLRMRAYARALANGKNMTEALSAANLEA